MAATNSAPETNLPDPRQPWVLSMNWKDLFFASWRIPIEVGRSLLPPQLELDTFDGSAWITIVPMRVTDMHWHGIPPIAGWDGFRELNLRTYVRQNGRAAACFLGIECPAGFSDWIARRFFGVPYYDAQMIAYNDGGTYHYATERTLKDKGDAVFFGSFRPLPGGHAPAPGSLEYFLLERYCSYAVHDGKVHRVEIRHPEWALQEAEADIEVNTIVQSVGLTLPAKPDHVGFVRSTETLIYPPVPEDTHATAESQPQSKEAEQTFSFTSVWKIDAPLQQVWDALLRMEEWPSWWKGVEKVDVLNWGTPDRVGFRSRQVWKSKLPYTLRFEGSVDRVVPLERIEISSHGELQGAGLMRFANDGTFTTFQYDWNVVTTKDWMNVVAPVFKGAFSWNHDIIMNWGAEGLARKLGAKSVSTSDKGVF